MSDTPPEPLEHNDWTFATREARDLLRREPINGEGMSFELGPAWLEPEEVGRLIGGAG